MTIAIRSSGTFLFEPEGDGRKRRDGIPPLFKDTEVTINTTPTGNERKRTFAGSDRSYLEVTVSGSGAVGWVLEELVNRDFILEEPAPQILDKSLFTSVCLSAARLMGVNLHYLLALAQLKSGLTDFRPGASGVTDVEKRTGPYAFTLANWNLYRSAPEFGTNFTERDRFDPYNQPYAAAHRTRLRIELLRSLSAGVTPTLADMYFWELIPTALIDRLIQVDPARILADEILVLLQADPNIGDEAVILDQFIAQDRDFFFDGATKRTIAQARAVALDRVARGLNDTRALIGQISLDELAGDNLAAGPNDGVNSDAAGSDLLMKWGEGEVINVYGHLVLRLQQALNKALAADGQPPIDEDLEFGSNTATALNRWLAREGKPQSGTLTYADWEKLVREPRPAAFDLCAQITATFEGHGFKKIASNVGTSDGAVLTWGYNGFTFKFGQIQEILRKVDATDPSIVETIFGGKAAGLRQMLAMPGIPAQIAWVKANVLIDGALKTDWEKSFADCGLNRTVQDIQLAHAKKEYWDDKASPQAAKLGLVEPLSQALLFDIAIQNGGLQAAEISDIGQQFAGIGGSDTKEEKHRAVVTDRLLVRQTIVNGGNVEAVRGRKRILTSGTGKKSPAENVPFHLGYWGLEPRLTIREAGIDDGPTTAIGPSDIQGFDEFEQFFISKIGETDVIKARNFLFKGNSQARSGGLNSDPPRDKWGNIAPVANLLKALATELGCGLKFNSVYRSDAYNRFIGGARESRHTKFDAVDFVPTGGVTLKQAHSLLDKWRSGPSPRFRGGLHRYDTFIHVDTRGTNSNW